MTLPLQDKEKILAHLGAIRVYLQVSDHDPKVVIEHLKACLEEERLYDDHICLQCKMPWALHPRAGGPDGEFVCVLEKGTSPALKDVIP